MSSNKSLLKIVFGVFMALFYLLVAIMLVFTPIFSNMPVYMRIIVGVLFFLYGAFRAYRLWKDL